MHAAFYFCLKHHQVSRNGLAPRSLSQNKDGYPSTKLSCELVSGDLQTRGSSELYTSRFRINKYSVKESHRNDTDARLQPWPLHRQRSVTHVHVLLVVIIPVHFGFPRCIPTSFISSGLLCLRGGRL